MEDERNRAELTTLPKYLQSSSGTWPTQVRIGIWEYLAPQTQTPFAYVWCAAPGAQVVVEVSSQSVGSTSSTYSLISQRRAHAPLTASPPKQHMVSEHRMAASSQALWRLFRVHLSGIFPGQVPPRAPRSTPTTRADFRGVGRYAAASRARIQRLMPSSPLRLPTHTCPLDPGRCLQPRRHRRQRRRLDGPHSRARCRRLRHRRRPLWRLSRASN